MGECVKETPRLGIVDFRFPRPMTGPKRGSKAFFPPLLFRWPCEASSSGTLSSHFVYWFLISGDALSMWSSRRIDHWFKYKQSSVRTDDDPNGTLPDRVHSGMRLSDSGMRLSSWLGYQTEHARRFFNETRNGRHRLECLPRNLKYERWRSVEKLAQFGIERLGNCFCEALLSTTENIGPNTRA